MGTPFSYATGGYSKSGVLRSLHLLHCVLINTRLPAAAGMRPHRKTPCRHQLTEPAAASVGLAASLLRRQQLPALQLQLLGRGSHVSAGSHSWQAGGRLLQAQLLIGRLQGIVDNAFPAPALPPVHL